MVLTRPLLFAAACALPLSIVACGGSGSDGGMVVPEGMHYGYVVSKATVPPTSAAAVTPMYSLDLAGKTSEAPDGTNDNQLGRVLGTLPTFGFKIQDTLDAAINDGSIILLIDFQTKDFGQASAAGFGVKLGANPVPAACTNPTDPTTCGKHLTGTASFSIAPDSPTDALVTGTIDNGTFKGGPGHIELQIALGTPQPITLSLSNARTQATSITADGLTAIVGGALTVDDLNTQVIPVIADQVAMILMRDCSTTTPPFCGCTSGSTGALLLPFLDGADGTAKDCKVSAAEVMANPVTKPLLAPDICSTKSCTAPDALSVDIKVQTVKAMFPTM